MNDEQGPLDLTPPPVTIRSEPVSQAAPVIPKPNRGKVLLLIVVAIMVLAGIGGFVFWRFRQKAPQPSKNKVTDTKVQEIDVSAATPKASSFSVTDGDKVVVNGQLQATQSIVLNPSGPPGEAVLGQLYLDETTNQLLYYNGTAYVALGGGSVTNIFQTGVSSLQGQTGAVSFVGVNGITVSGTNVSVDASVARLDGSGNNQVFTGIGQIFRNAANGTAAFQVQNAANVSILAVNTAAGQTVLGQSGSLNGNLVVQNAANNNTITVQTATPTANRVITLPDADGTICLSTNNCGFSGGANTFVNGGNSFGGVTSLGNNDNFDLNIETSGLTRLTVEADGDLMVDSGTLFVDAANNRVGIGTTSVSGSRLVVDNGSTSDNILQLQDNGNPVLTVADGGAVTANIRVLTPELNNISAGTLSVGTASTATTIQIGTPSTAALTQAINIGTNSGAGSTTNVTIGSATGTSTTTIRGGGGIQIGTGFTPSVNIQTASDIATAFQLQDADDVQILAAGTLANPNLITGGNFELASEISGWTNKGGSTLSHNTSTAYLGAGSMRVVTTATANQGASYSFAFVNGTQYTFEVYGKLASGTFTDFRVGHVDGGSDVDCNVGLFSPIFDQTMVTTGWTQYKCTFTASNTTAVYVKQNGGTARTFYLDNASLWASGSGTFSAASGTLRLNGQITSPLLVQPVDDSTTSFHVMAANGYNVLNVDTINQGVTAASSIGTALSGRSTGGNGISGITIHGSSYGVTGTGFLVGGGVYGIGSNLPGVYGQAFSTVSGLFQTNNDQGTNSNPTLVARSNTSQSANLFEVQNTSGGALLKVSSTGATTITNTSTSALLVETAGGSAVLNVDTTNTRVGIGRNNPGATLDVDSSTSSSNIEILRVITDVGGANNTKFAVDSDGYVSFDGGLSVGATAFISGIIQLGTQTVTLTDDGVANDTATITTSVLIINVDETANAGVPNLVITELTVFNLGTPLFIWNSEADGTHDTFTITDTAGVVELPGGATVTLGPWDTLSLIYANDRWVTLAQSNN